MKFKDLETERRFYDVVYDILIKFAKAPSRIMFDGVDSEKVDFVNNHLSTAKYPCQEWRFCGVFGFGGKYRSGRNVVTYYPEHQTLALNQLQHDINVQLSELYNEFSK